jgi:4-amino-4-deoxy-L-arabinose transferase-like glycosyltransferase
VIDRLARSDGGVYLLLAAYFIANILLRLAAPASLEIDEGTQLLYAQWLAPGYDTQPPFYNWAQYWVVQIFGNTVFAVSFLKNLMLFLGYALFGLAARLVLKDRVMAVIATLGLITLPQIGYEAQRDLTHTVAVFFNACLFGWAFFRTLQRPTAMNYALTGLAIGFGMLSKYNFAFLPLVAAVALLPDRRLRVRLFDPRILLMLAVSALIVSPHAFWLVDHFRRATTNTILRLTVDAGEGGLVQIGHGMLSLAGALAAFVLPTLLVFWIAFGRALPQALRVDNEWSRLIGRMFLATLVLLVIVVLAGASNIKDRWLVPVFFLLPIYLCAKLEASGEDALPGAARRFGWIVAAIMILIPLAIFVRPLLGGVLGDYGKQNVPYGPAIAEILASNAQNPSIIVAGDRHLAGNMRLSVPGIPATAPGYSEYDRPYLFDAAHPILVVWRTLDGKVSANPSRYLWLWLENKGLADRPLDVRVAAAPYIYGREGDLYHFSYAWIYPPSGS